MPLIVLHIHKPPAFGRASATSASPTINHQVKACLFGFDIGGNKKVISCNVYSEKGGETTITLNGVEKKISLLKGESLKII